MLTKDFWYELPQEQIAQAPAEPRDSSRLMILDPKNGSIEHDRFFNLGKYLRPGDLLVINDTKVFKARLKATVACHPEWSPTESRDLVRSDQTRSFDSSRFAPFAQDDKKRHFEVFLLRPDQDTWLALAKPGRKLSQGDVLDFNGAQAKLIEKLEDGIVRLDFGMPTEKVFEFADKYGETPTPPYVKEPPKEERDYQTVYADKLGSAAAPTAGFHFTPELIEKLKNQGINFATVTLHVGLGTFRPIMTENIEDHKMHQEWIEVSQKTCDVINETKGRGGRVIAVGTTSVRALESAARGLDSCRNLSRAQSRGRNDTRSKEGFGQLQPFAGFTDIFIKMGDAFHIVDGLITNFHLPESTLLVLVSAFAQTKSSSPDHGRQFVLKAYSDAIKNEYRFYSFGDAMLIQ